MLYAVTSDPVTEKNRFAVKISRMVAAIPTKTANANPTIRFWMTALGYQMTNSAGMRIENIEKPKGTVEPAPISWIKTAIAKIARSNAPTDRTTL